MQTGGKPVGYVPESGQRKPSSLPASKKQVQVKTEPDEKDVQFAAVIQRLIATQDNVEPNHEQEEQQQPLTNNETLAVAMDVDEMAKQEAEEVARMPEEDGEQDIMNQGVKQEGPNSEAKIKQEHHPSATASEAP